MAGERLRPRKIEAETEAAILAARRLEPPGRSMGRIVMYGDGHIRLDGRVALFAGYANILLGIVNLRRLLAGKKPF